MQQVLAETISNTTRRAGGLVQQVFSENTPDIHDFVQQQQDALQTVRRKLRHQQPVEREPQYYGRPHERGRHRQQRQTQEEHRNRQQRSRDRVGAYATVASHQYRQDQKSEPTQEDLAVFVRLQEQEYKAIQRRNYEQMNQRQQQVQHQHPPPNVSYPDCVASPSSSVEGKQNGNRNRSNVAHSPMGQESYDKYVERQDKELRKIAQMKIGPSPKNVPAAASKPAISSSSPTGSEIDVTNLYKNFVDGGGSVSGSEASLDEFIESQKMALKSFRSAKSAASNQKGNLKDPPQPSLSPPTLARLRVPQLLPDVTSPRLKQAPMEIVRLHQAPPSQGRLKQPPPSSIASLQPAPPIR